MALTFIKRFSVQDGVRGCRGQLEKVTVSISFPIFSLISTQMKQIHVNEALYIKVHYY
jgi:hypothetical protein